jgi:hypothetical protein
MSIKEAYDKGFARGLKEANAAGAAVSSGAGTGLLNFGKNLVGGTFNVARGAVSGAKDAYTALQAHMKLTPEQAIALRDAGIVGTLGYGGYKIMGNDDTAPPQYPHR